MCFDNDIEQLNRLRRSRKPLTVWKLGNVDHKTGTLYSGYGYGNQRRRVDWLQGTTVKPHKILEPLAHGKMATAGLYFYTSEAPDGPIKRVWGTIDMFENVYGMRLPRIIVALVSPRNIIAAEGDVSDTYGITICCTKAKVIRTLSPNISTLPRLKYNVTQAKKDIRDKDERTKKIQQEMNKWEEERNDHLEALEQMTEQLAKLTA